MIQICILEYEDNFTVFLPSLTFVIDPLTPIIKLNGIFRLQIVGYCLCEHIKIKILIIWGGVDPLPISVPN